MTRGCAGRRRGGGGRSDKGALPTPTQNTQSPDIARNTETFDKQHRVPPRTATGDSPAGSRGEGAAAREHSLCVRAPGTAEKLTQQRLVSRQGPRAVHKAGVGPSRRARLALGLSKLSPLPSGAPALGSWLRPWGQRFGLFGTCSLQDETGHANRIGCLRMRLA